MLSDEKLKKIAELQLKIAVIDGEAWAIKHVLGGIKINITNIRPENPQLEEMSDDELKILRKFASVLTTETDELDQIEREQCQL